MKQTIALLFYMFFAVSFGQVGVDPNDPSQSVDMRSVVTVEDKVLSFGYVTIAGTKNAFVSCANQTSVDWAYSLTDTLAYIPGVFLSLKLGELIHAVKTANGNIFAVGSHGKDALLMKASATGVDWVKKVSTNASVSDTVESFHGVTEDADGNIYCVGIRGVASSHPTHSWRGFIVKMDPLGNVIWTKEGRYPSGSNPQYFTRVFYRDGSIFVWGTFMTTTVAPNPPTSRDVGLCVFDASTGNLLVHKTFGSFTSEYLIDVVAYESDFIIAYKFITNQLAGLMRVNPSLDLVGSSYIRGFAGSPSQIIAPMSLVGGSSGVYLLGITQETGSGTDQWSFACKIDLSTLGSEWFEVFGVNSFAQGGGLFGDGTLVVNSTQNGAPSAAISGSTLTFFDTHGNSYGCHGLSGYVPEEVQVFGNGSYFHNTASFVDVNSVSVSDMSMDEYAPATYYCPTALPVELLKFDAIASGGKSLLVWQSASEIDFDRFEVEVSSDLHTWSMIDVVEPVGSPVGASYEAWDESPENGPNYYRLRMVDKDGTFEYSDVRVVHHDVAEETSLLVYPNPILVGQPVTVAGEGELVCTDASGRSVPVSKSAINQQVFIDAGQGVYNLVLTSGSGRKVARLIIN